MEAMTSETIFQACVSMRRDEQRSYLLDRDWNKLELSNLIMQVSLQRDKTDGLGIVAIRNGRVATVTCKVCPGTEWSEAQQRAVPIRT